MKKTAAIFLLLLMANCCTAQSIPALTLTQIDESDGLSDNNIQCVLKDKTGKLWIGTADGLNELDGSGIKRHYPVPGNAAGIISKHILDLAEDQRGNIWIATGMGVSCYKKDRQQFENILLPQSKYGASNIVNSIQFLHKDELICGTEGGLYLLNINSKKFTPFFNLSGDEKNNYRFCNTVHKLLLGADTTIWICTSDGFWKYNFKTKEFKKINGQNSTAYNPLCMFVYESSDKKLWIGNWGVGLQQVDKNSDSVISYHLLPGKASNVSCINEMPNGKGKYLLLLNGELNAFDPFENKFIQLQKPFSLQQYPDVKTIHYSADGWLWLGSSNTGLYAANPQAQHFQHHFFGGNITTQSVLLNEWKDSLLIGAEGTSLLKQYNNNWQPVKDFYNNMFPSPANNNVFATLSLTKENDNSWWIGTSAGLVRINPNNDKHRWFVAKRKDSSLPSNFITGTYLDNQKQLWIFPWRQGIWKMDMQRKKFFKVFNAFTTEAGIEKKLVVANAAEDDAGNLWMADIDEGIILFEKITGQFSKPFAKQLGERYNTSRVYYANGFMYSFTGNTLLKWKDGSSVQKIELPEGLNKELYDMAPDKNNNWWLAGKSGLICYNETQNNFKKFNTGDGLVNNNMNGTLFCRSNGDMFFATASYCTSFSPAAVLSGTNQSAKVLLTGVYVNDSLVAAGNNLLNLSHQQNNLLFQWALPDYTNPFANNYYCQLKGIDSAWRYVGNKGAVQYANLAPGSYTILLKAAAAGGTTASNTIIIQFAVLAPYWQRTWFLLTGSFLAALLIFLLVRKRIQAIRKKAALQEEISELEMKALRAQMNPHFIFNSLNSIQECIVMKNTDAAYNYLSQFSKLVRRILENSGKATVPLSEEIELMQWYLNLEKLRFTDELHISIQNKFSDASFEIPAMVIQPFLENALWHGLAHKQGNKTIKLLLYESLNRVNIVIEDNGIGRKAAAALPQREGKTSMGLQISKERLQHFSYASSVEIVDLMDGEGNAAGTKVIIHLPNY